MKKIIPVKVPCKDGKDKILKYLRVLYQFHKLTDKEMELLTELIFQYKRHIKQHGEEVTNKLVFETESRKEIRKNVSNMTDAVLYNYFSNLRKKGVIIGKTINKKFIPPSGEFQIVFTFDGKSN